MEDSVGTVEGKNDGAFVVKTWVKVGMVLLINNSEGVGLELKIGFSVRDCSGGFVETTGEAKGALTADGESVGSSLGNEAGEAIGALIECILGYKEGDGTGALTDG